MMEMALSLADAKQRAFGYSPQHREIHPAHYLNIKTGSRRERLLPVLSGLCNF
jgi:hypothetical protein